MHCFVFYYFLEKLLLNYLVTPNFLFWIPIALAKICFPV